MSKKSSQPPEESLGLERIVFFSDAVMAIAITPNLMIFFIGGDHRLVAFTSGCLSRLPLVDQRTGKTTFYIKKPGSF
jgi:hypothetical protein